MHPDREVRRAAAEVTAGLAPGCAAFVYNTLLNDKSIDDRLRTYPTWLSSRNLANEASDDSVQALVGGAAPLRHPPAVVCAEGACLVAALADYDRMASIGRSEKSVGWSEAKTTVLGTYRSFSPELADVVQRFFDERWIDAPVREGGRAHSAPTRCRRITRTCCSTGPPARATCRRSLTSWATGCTGIWPGRRVFHRRRHARRDRVGLRRDRHQPTAAGRPRRSH